MKQKLLPRDDFRNGVFARDKHRCVFCGKTAEDTPEGKLDAHHVIERRLFTEEEEKGGYFLDNGVTVCEDHHLLCETTELSVEEVREAAGIDRKVVPSYFYAEDPIDKWGNLVMPNGQRTKGPLFADASVQKVLARGGKLALFTPYVKYGRTVHLPWSQSMNEDDRMVTDMSYRARIYKMRFERWRKQIMNNKLRRFHAWLPNFVARHAVSIDIDLSQDDKSDEFLTRMENFRPRYPWTIDHNGSQLIFRFCHDDDAVMFKLMVF